MNIKRIFIFVLVLFLLITPLTGCKKTKPVEDNTGIEEGTKQPKETEPPKETTELPSKETSIPYKVTTYKIEHFGWNAGAFSDGKSLIYSTPVFAPGGLGVFYRDYSKFDEIKKLAVFLPPRPSVEQVPETNEKGDEIPETPPGKDSQEPPSEPTEPACRVVGFGDSWATAYLFEKKYSSSSTPVSNWEVVGINFKTKNEKDIRKIISSEDLKGNAYSPRVSQSGSFLVYDITERASFTGGSPKSSIILYDYKTNKAKTLKESTQETYMWPTIRDDKVLYATVPKPYTKASDIKVMLLDINTGKEERITNGIILSTFYKNYFVFLDVRDGKNAYVILYDRDKEISKNIYYSGGIIGTFDVSDKAVVFTDTSDKTGWLYEIKTGKLYKLNEKGTDIMNVYIAGNKVYWEMQKVISDTEKEFTLGEMTLD